MLEKSSEEMQKHTHDSGFLAMNSDSHSWAEEIPWLRARTKMQIWIKGVLTAEDVFLAREYWCDGVILDGSPATIDVLAECVNAAADEIRVHIDGGFGSGADNFKAIALRAYNGQKGVQKAVKILHDEFRRCMMLTGCKTMAEISRAVLGIVRADGPFGRL
ncbi:(S)-2-hydroxy-acid oxidase [Diplocarpon rosae]|nr:(S)-2-hydroxy-acid oxidase [Diplocarpon rosae]